MPRENSFSDSDGASLTSSGSHDEREFPSPRRSTTVIPPISPHHAHFENVPTHGHGHHDHSPGVTVVETPSPQPAITSASRHSLQSHRSRATARTGNGHLYATKTILTPKERFRQAAKKVIALRRGATIISGGQIGAEPGVDPRKPTAQLLYGHIHQDCVIEVSDYSALRSSVGRMTNKEFVQLMEDDKAFEREPWVKVRWINIGGLSWDVIKAVSLRYELHPLALEDLFHARSQNRSKADYYTRHLFIRVLCHELGQAKDLKHGDSAAFGSTLADAPRTTSPEPMDIEDGKDIDEEKEAGSIRRRRKPLLPHHHGDIPPNTRLSRLGLLGSDVKEARKERKHQEISLEALKGDQRVHVKVSPMFIFLLRDGTIISIHPTPSLEYTAPVTRRVHQPNTLLRSSADASLVVQALLDLVVDRALGVIDAYHDQIKRYENSVLLKTKMETVRSLHILSGDLILHERTLQPIKTLVYGLRRYDLDRCAALVDTSNPENAGKVVKGFMSHKSKIYLADVYDHIDYILTSLDMFENITENLIAYTFNIASYEMNEVMRRLTLVTVIFMPLTLLTGYFGMNFEFMRSVQVNSDAYFWWIAVPVMCFIVPIFIYPDIQRAYRYLKKQMVARKAVESAHTDD